MGKLGMIGEEYEYEYEYLLDQHEAFHLRVGVVISQTPRSVLGGADCEKS